MIARTGDVLIDSTAWIQLLRRKGNAAVRDRVKELMAGDRAVWCDVIQLELWRGASSESDRKELGELRTEIRSLEISPEVWNSSFEIAAKCRPNGLVVPPTDIIIFSCAHVHQVEIYHLDKHFKLLAALM